MRQIFTTATVSLGQIVCLLSLFFSVSTGCGTELAEDPCDELESALEECVDDECGSDYLQNLNQQCEVQYGDKSDGAKDWLISKLSARAQVCWDTQDANCMWWVYKALASGSYVSGYADAGRNLHNFLYCGGDLAMNPASFMLDPAFQSTLDLNLLDLEIDLLGLPQGTTLTREYVDAMTQFSVTDKLFPAVGKYTVTTVIEGVEVTPLVFQMHLKFSVYDRYDWNGGQQATIGGSTFLDDWGIMLVDAGLACDYDIRSTWTLELER